MSGFTFWKSLLGWRRRRSGEALESSQGLVETPVSIVRLCQFSEIWREI
jgi:hypothetical protein